MIALSAIALTGSVVAVPQAQAQTYSNDRINLQPGTVIPVTLDSELSSDNSREGDVFTATVDTSRSAYDALMRGAHVEGTVDQATPRSGNDPGVLKLSFNRLVLADGSSVPISGTPTSLNSNNITVTGDGMLVARSVKTDRSGAYAGIGAGAGLLLDVISGQRVRIGDLLLGGALGYAAGQFLKNGQVHDVDLASGTPMGVVLKRSAYYHRGAPVYLHTPSPVALKYYRFHGEEWSYNPATGERLRVGVGPQTDYSQQSGRKYYSFQGHPYYLDLATGERVRLD
jgi:hypothetical protein